MRVSFILPIYNVEKYLAECVESILAQTYSDFEVLLVDDGSPDNCPQLCDEWAAKDCRIKALHKPNGGLSDARNYGLEHALGDYVIFVDSDDFWVGNDSLENLMAVVDAHPECDFISFNCLYYYPSTNTYKKWVPFDESLAMPVDKDTAMHSLVASGTLPMSACLKVISRKSLSDMRLSFIKGLYSEDIPWFIELLTRSSSFCFVNLYIYAYRKEVSGSISSCFSEKKFSDLLFIVNSGVEKACGMDASEGLKHSLLSFWAYEYCILAGESLCLEHAKRKGYQGELDKLDWLMSYTENPKVRKVCLVRKLLGWAVTKRLMHLYITKVLWK